MAGRLLPPDFGANAPNYTKPGADLEGLSVVISVSRINRCSGAKDGNRETVSIAPLLTCALHEASLAGRKPSVKFLNDS